MKKNLFLLFLPLLLALHGCQTIQVDPKKKDEKKIEKAADPFEKENIEFLKPQKNSEELFRILFTSTEYTVSQMRYEGTISRVEDKGGDNYMREELKKFDKIDEARTGTLKIWLFPDSGKIMKIRPQQPTYLIEIDKLINEDIQRWNFKFPQNYVNPSTFIVKYRVVLRKNQTDEQIMKEIRQKMIDEK